MPIQGYECRRCGFLFEDWKPFDPGEVYVVRCPKCGGTDVKESEAAKEYLELVRDMGRTGG